MNQESSGEGPKTARVESTLKLKFISHGTLESKDLDFTRRFYEEFLGFEVVRPAKISLWCRLGGQHIYVVVAVQPGRKAEMPLLNHNGIDVETEEEVDECHRLVMRDAEKWKLHKISKPAVQHGTYSFFFWDADDNSWEILANPPGGYTWMFERGDQEGIGHMSRKFDRPASTLRKTPEPTEK
jgi:catechol 2,3-dioxygenase-like lactoylglutathione lyase family enzyme